MAVVHVPDGFIDAQVSAAAGVLSAAAVVLSVRRSREELQDATAPMAGLVAVFIFAAQMINFPVGAGTSGHLIGGALAAILVGPATGMLAMTVVLMVQALVFADGGITALGINVLNMAVVATLVGYGAFRLATRVLPRSRRSVMVGSFAAGLASVLAAAGAFSIEFARGGTTAIDPAAVAAAMIGVHAVIGVMEGLITAFVVGSIIAVRPDLVRSARDRMPPPDVMPDGPRRVEELSR